MPELTQANAGHFARKCPTCNRQLRRSTAERIGLVAVSQAAMDPSFRGVSVLPLGVGVKTPSGKVVRLQLASNPILSAAVLRKMKRKPVVKQDAAVIVQADAYRRVVTAVVQQPNTPHDVWIKDDSPAGGQLVEITYPPETLVDAAENFMAQGRWKSVGLDHDEVVGTDIKAPDGSQAIVVQSYISPVEWTTTDHEGLERTVKRGSWVMSFKMMSDDAWQGVLDGRFRAPSLSSNDFELEPDEPALDAAFSMSKDVA